MEDGLLGKYRPTRPNECVLVYFSSAQLSDSILDDEVSQSHVIKANSRGVATNTVCVSIKAQDVARTGGGRSSNADQRQAPRRIQLGCSWVRSLSA